MQFAFALAVLLATLAALGLAIAVIIYAVFFLFNFIPWNGIRRRPSSAQAFRHRASATDAQTESPARESNLI